MLGLKNVVEMLHEKLAAFTARSASREDDSGGRARV
jgi:hypothetical protein